MRELDGSDAGGQYLRSALALAALRGEPVRIENVRGDRPNPGLAHQHLATLETASAICDADVSGADLGSETVTFEPEPGRIEGGSYRADIGTAGSISLLFDAILPLATRLEAPLSVTATGGTDVAWSPPMDYLRYVTLPLLERYGLRASLDLARRGFYPVGGGRATLELEPSTLEPIELGRRGDPEGVRVYSTEAAALADAEVARRQAEGALERLRGTGLETLERVETTAQSACPGSAIVLRLEHETGLAGFSALGEKGKLAERVGKEAANDLLGILEGGASVDRHMADQLLVPLALAGGRVRIPAVTDHVEAGVELLAEFGYEIGLEGAEEGAPTVVSERPTGD
ncbi:RNA 3'-terminal phosphate cyclase [Natrononativus amylolyticus]|uniref:RNA 3'-terminal phosphate cyclase n=1 Tax=Natrononativus amylolyticus TaxID=2963434 RepID=UPI0020CD7B92|nr:RNA 3'-terminal phosphate cyclase [Natrononativus amylolyticus]